MNTISELSLNNNVQKQVIFDIFSGLSASPKYLPSKYFYDSQGDVLFQQIMNSPEYYLTDCEMEIFKYGCTEMLEISKIFPQGFDLIELGAGNAVKTSYLLKCLIDNKVTFKYYPIDISANVIRSLNKDLPAKIPGLQIQGVQGDYFDALKKVLSISSRPRVLMFLGANIGNMPPEEALDFCLKLRAHLSLGDLLLIGFDLKKDPWVIFNAYNDQSGITQQFNLNILARLNRELDADFDISQFHHFENYDPMSGACNSYLISKIKQTATVAGKTFSFEENECIFTETSQKYTIVQVDDFAAKSGFTVLQHLMDSKKWFTDVIWQAV